MNPVRLSAELASIQRRTRGMIVGSIAVHVVLLLFLVAAKSPNPEDPGLTEITWLEAEPAQETAMLVPQKIDPERVTTAPDQELSTPAPEPERFERTEEKAVVQPTETLTRANRDRMSERLVALQEKANSSVATAPALVVDGAVSRPVSANVATPAPRRETLSRAGTSSPVVSPIALERTSKSAPRAVPLAEAAPVSDTTTPSAPADSDASRNVAGAQLLGPVANRPLESFRPPTYPEWAQDDGVEATVRLYFVVLADGRVKTNVLVRRTSGYPDFDRNAVTALRTWKFEPLVGGATGEQWGEITFHFKLEQADG